MQDFYWEPGWLPVVEEQERLLQYGRFTHETAFELGLLIKKEVERRACGSAAIRIVEDGAVVFAYKMPGTSLENDWWMDRKLNVSRLTGTSSVRAYLEAKSGLRRPFWQERPDNYAACGGCFPIFLRDGGPGYAYALVSGLHHQEDHQVIADAMAGQLGVRIRSIAE